MRQKLYLLVLTILLTLTYFPLNHWRHPHVWRTAWDDHIGLVSIFAIPYLLFWPAFWLFFLASLENGGLSAWQ